MIVNDHLGYANGAVHGPSRWLAGVLPVFDPAKVQASVTILGAPHPFAAELERQGGHITFLNRSKWDPRALHDLITLVRERRIEVLHVMGMKGLIVGRLAARYVGCRVIVNLRDMTPVPQPLRFALRSLAAWTDLALGCSLPVARFATEHFRLPPEKTLALNNAIPVECYKAASADGRRRVRAELGLHDADRAIGVIGRLVPVRNHEAVLYAMQEVVERVDGARLIIVGDGERLPELRALARSLGLDQVVTFAGHRSDMADVLAALDVVAGPCLGEGRSLALLEAVATATPVVGFDADGVRDVVTHGTSGFLVPKSDTKALAEALVQVLKDKALYQRLVAGCVAVRDSFGIEHQVRKLENVYLAVVLGRPPADFPQILAEDNRDDASEGAPGHDGHAGPAEAAL
jgi:glycosyltransferase involved in cell wall biosynthesis